MAKPQVILWAHFRSMSTAFFRSMWTVEGIKVFRELYQNSHYFGCERVNKRYLAEPVKDGATFMDIKNVYENAAEDYPDASCIFVKEGACYLHGKLDTAEFIPKGYVHTFLIRNPRDAITGLYDASLKYYKDYSDEAAYFDAVEVGYEDLWNVYTLLTEHMGQDNLLIMDADDLVDNPELVLNEFCRRTGIPFSKKMVEWGSETPEHIRRYFESDFFHSWLTPILKTTGLKRRHQQVRNLDYYPDEIKKEVERALPFYEKLHALRYIPVPSQ